jgi:hypothetical protein
MAFNGLVNGDVAVRPVFVGVFTKPCITFFIRLDELGFFARKFQLVIEQPGGNAFEHADVSLPNVGVDFHGFCDFKDSTFC